MCSRPFLALLSRVLNGSFAVPVCRLQALFKQKLELCSVIFNFDNAASNKRCVSDSLRRLHAAVPWRRGVELSSQSISVFACEAFAR